MPWCRPGRRALALVGAVSALAAGCGSDLETPADTLRSDGGPSPDVGYVIDELPEGYELCAVGVRSGLSIQADSSASLRVYAEGRSDDPYSGGLYGVAVFPAGPIAELDLGRTTPVDVDGKPGLLGGIDGLQIATLPPDEGRALSWQLDDGRVVQVAVRGDDEVDLVQLARSVEVGDDGGTIAAGALPSGAVDLGDVYVLEGQPQFLFSLDHQRVDDSGAFVDQLTMLGASGGLEAMEAFRFRAVWSERILVGDAPGVVAEVGDGRGPRVVSWLVDDDVILRLFSFELDGVALAELAESALRLEGEDWEQLLADLESSRCRF